MLVTRRLDEIVADPVGRATAGLLLTSDRWERILVSTFDTREMADPRTVLLQGTLDLLILRALWLGSNHGLGVARRVQQITRGTFDVGPGSLFPALHRLEEQGWLKSKWGESENNRRAKYYELTKAGRKHIETETAAWSRIAAAMAAAISETS